MGRLYRQFGLAERIEIERLRSDGLSMREIANHIGRAPSSISRELKRNSKPTKQWAGGYVAERADHLALRRRRWDGRFKMMRQPALRDFIKDRLVMGWSPEQISGWLTQSYGRTLISHESIYRFIYHRSAQKDYWHKLLPRTRYRRGRYSRRKAYELHHLKDRLSIHQRPDEAISRNNTGHWEADLMLFATYGQAVLVCYDRQSRLMLASLQQGKTSTETMNEMVNFLKHLPPSHRQTMLCDNGTEFAKHHILKQQTGIQTYFCDLHAPWQKGGVENSIGRLRRTLPRKTDLKTMTQQHLNQIINNYNNTPRKCLEYHTPAEIFYKNIQPLHFIRESTSPPAQV